MVAKRKNIDTDYLVREYRSGRSAYDLSREVGLGASNIVRRLREAGVAIRSRKLNLPSEHIANLYAAGMSEKALADKLQISRRAIRARLIEQQVDVRGRSQAETMKWAQMTEQQRFEQTAAAHRAARGVVMASSSMEQRATTVQSIGRVRSAYEQRLTVMLQERGINVVAQDAIGPYNCDLGAYPVAVEIFGGKWHWYGHHLARTEKRFRYIMDAGWHILAIAVNDVFPLTASVADYVTTYIQEARRHPSRRREYRVIWGAGEFATGGCIDDTHISIKPPFTNRRNPATGQYERVPR